MISPQTQAEIERLLAAGLHTQRMIAAMTGVSRGTVQAIHCGRRGDRVAAGLRLADDGVEPSATAERCAGCGGRVFMPCRLCRVRAWQSRSRRRRAA